MRKILLIPIFKYFSKSIKNALEAHSRDKILGAVHF